MSLGKKYTCFKCKTKFYDLNKPEAICPKCGADQRDDPNPEPQEPVIPKYKRPAASESPRAAKKGLIPDEEEEEDFDEDLGEDAEPGFDEDDEDFADLEEEPEEPEDEDYD